MDLQAMIEVIRKEKKMSKIDLASSVNIHRTTLANIEQGKTADLKTVERIFAALGYSLQLVRTS